MNRLFNDRREALGAVLFFGAILASMVLEAAGVMYGWGVAGCRGAAAGEPLTTQVAESSAGSSRSRPHR